MPSSSSDPPDAETEPSSPQGREDLDSPRERDLLRDPPLDLLRDLEAYADSAETRECEEAEDETDLKRDRDALGEMGRSKSYSDIVIFVESEIRNNKYNKY